MAVLRPAGELDSSYAYDMATIRRRWQWLLLVFFILALYALPLYADDGFISLVDRIAMMAIAVEGLNLLTGYTGQISLGQGAFMMVGGYISTLLIAHLGWPYLLALPAAALGAGLVGLIFGLPSLRIKGFYVLMATLAAQIVIPWFVLTAYPDVLNGLQGLNVPAPRVFGFTIQGPVGYLYLSLTLLIPLTIVAHNIARSRLGRAFVAIRDNDLAAEIMGVDLFWYKLEAFFLAAVYAGISGSLMAHYLGHIDSVTFGLEKSVFLLGMLVVGGLGTSLGPILGAITIEYLFEAAAVLSPAVITVIPTVGESVIQALPRLFFGIALMTFLILEPRGLAHRWRLIKAAWRLRPFSH